MRAKLFSISELDHFRGIVFLNIYSWLSFHLLTTSNFKKKSGF